MAALKTITAPATEPVTLSEAKAHLRLDTTTEDSIVTDLIRAAREYCETYQNRTYITQTLELTLDGWPSFPIELPRPPLASVVSIKYYDSTDNEYTWDASEYFADTDSEPGRIGLRYNKSLPSKTLREMNAVKIRFTAGGSSAPAMVKQAMLLLIGFWFENREAVSQGTVSREVAFSVHALLDRNRVLVLC